MHRAVDVLVLGQPLALLVVLIWITSQVKAALSRAAHDRHVLVHVVLQHELRLLGLSWLQALDHELIESRRRSLMILLILSHLV